MQRLQGLITGVVLVAYPLAVYAGLSKVSPRTIALILLALLIPTVVSRLRKTPPAALRTLAFIPVVTAAVLGLAALANAAGLVLALPVVINVTLLFAFGATLTRQIPIIERFARLAHDDLTGDEIRWCRTWTVLWCVFFALNALAALALALWAPLEWWTLYNGLIAYLLMGALFAVEYIVRKVRFRRFGTGWHDRLLSRLVSH